MSPTLSEPGEPGSRSNSRGPSDAASHDAETALSHVEDELDVPEHIETETQEHHVFTEPASELERPRDEQIPDFNAATAANPDWTSDRPDQIPSAREIVRLFQCRLCSLPFRDPVTLPCGKSICKLCVPQSHIRVSVTYPAQPDRLEGFQCPFSECAKEHSLGDCSVDVILNKAAQHMKDEIALGREVALKMELSTHVVPQDPWLVAGVSSLKDDETCSMVIAGSKLVATWTMAQDGNLRFDAEVSYGDVQTPKTDMELVDTELAALNRARGETRVEMDCQICYALFYDPLTTGCGHTFCRPCLHRILDHSRYCPICRRKLNLNPLLNRISCPSNECVIKIMDTYWKDELADRNTTAAAELAARDEDLDLPLFICTLSFPYMPTFLHVFEPRYRLMIRRVLDGNRLFGMVMPKRPRHSDDADFHEIGTLLRLVNVQFYPDGRSLLETVGLSRFRVLRHGSLDGYTVGNTQRIDDISLQEEESIEASEVSRRPVAQVPSAGEHRENGQESPEDGDQPATQAAQGTETNPSTLISAADVETMSTQDLMQYATAFVARMRIQSVPWLTERMLAIYGECPDDPAIFPWWLASMLPVRDREKHRLLSTTSVRDRLKICCSWILEWESRTWMRVVDDRPGLSPSAPSSEADETD